MLSLSDGYILVAAYAFFILALVLISKPSHESADEFLLMNRKLGVARGSMSIAVSWVWAPAVFIVGQKAYTQGLPGVFWFTLPNILCFFIFIPIALKIRQILPAGYTVSQVFRDRFAHTRLPHYAALVVVVGYQLGAIIINAVAGAVLIQLLTGIPYVAGVLMMLAVSLSYSLISGLRASVLSDVAQMLMILGVALVLVPWVLLLPEGPHYLQQGLAGVSGEFGNIFDPHVAYSFGIAATIGLIAGPVADQMFSQRAMAARPNAIKRIFFFGGLIFGLVPLLLSLLGFVGAGAEINGALQVSDAQMVGPETIGLMLPRWALMAFAVMAFASLTSTLDSAFCALSAIIATDFDPDNRYAGPYRIAMARKGMITFALIGGGLAVLKPQLLWVFLIYGALASSLFVPILLALFWSRVTARGVFWGMAAGIVLGTPLSIVANINNYQDLIVLSAVVGLVLPGVVAYFVSLTDAAPAEMSA